MSLNGPLPPDEHVAFQSPLGDEIEGELFHPLNATPPYPAVLCIHSIYQTGEMSAPMAQELARNGFMALNPPLLAHSERAGRDKTQLDYQAEMLAGIAFLRHRKDVRPDWIFVTGHSMGGDLACMVGTADPELRATLPLGFPVQATAREPANLLVSVGVWDPLHPLQEMLGVLRAATDGKGDRPDTRYGDFAKRSARELLLLPWSDHGLEKYDPDFYSAAVRWMRASAGLPEGTPDIRMPYRMIGSGVGCLGGLGCLLWGGLLLRRAATAWLAGLPAFWSDRTLILPALVSIVALGLLYRAWPYVLLHQIMLGVLVAACLLDALRPATADAFAAAVRRGLLYAGLAWVVAACACTLNLGRDLVAPGTPGLRSLGYFLWLVPMDAAVTSLKAATALFHERPHTTGIHPLLALLMVVELVAPGAMVRGVLHLANAGVRRLQALDLRLRATFSAPQMAMLAVLLVAAGLVWRQTLTAGYLLDLSEISRLAGILARLGLFPIVLAVAVLRSRWFRSMESSIQRPPD